MKDREFDKVGLQNLHFEQATIARGQGPSENVHFKANPTQPKTILQLILMLSNSNDFLIYRQSKSIEKEPIQCEAE